MPAIKLGATTKMGVTSVASQSAPVACEMVRLIATVDCHIAIGPSPAVDANSPMLPANSPEYFVVDSTDRIAAVRESADGSLYITAAA